jgi:hypothetical protein
MPDGYANDRPPPSIDPTELTTQAQIRGDQAERDYVDGQLEVLRERLRAIDRATELLSDTVNRVPNETQKEVAHLRELQQERFASIELQFRERDTRAERESRDNRVAVDAAFAAQKEAAAKQDENNQKSIDKSEAATAEAIGKLGELVQTNVNGLSGKIDDLKDRVGKIESIKLGATENRTGLYAAIGMVATIILLGIAIVGFIAAKGGP